MLRGGHVGSADSAGSNVQDPVAASSDDWFHAFWKLPSTHRFMKGLPRSNIRNIRVVILDTGIDGRHPFLRPEPYGKNWGQRLKGAMSFDEEGNLHEEPPWTDCNGNFDECSGYRDIDGHGTYCAGLVFQIAPEADVFIAKVTPPNTREADPDVVACAIHYATRAWKADIISMSLGFDCPDVALEVALNEHPKTVVFAAAANHGTNGRSITFPASIPSVICVKSANGDGTTSSFCPNTHLPNQISALGEEVLSMWPVDETRGTMQRRCRGTSVSTPIAAAIAALVLDFVYTGCLSNKVMVPNMQNVVDDVKRFPRDRLLRLLQSDLFSNPDQSGAVRNVVPWLLLRDDLRVREGVHTQAARKIRDLLNPHGY